MQPFLKDILLCPDCGRSDLEYLEQAITCSRCQSVYRIEDGIPYFLSENRYWGNLPQDRMRQIVEYAGTHGFHAALTEKIPKYLHSAILSTGRADARFFLPIDKESTILDLGCMWGTLTLGLAEHCAHVVGLDQTLETLQLGSFRAREAGLPNVTFIGGDARRIPIKEGTFDVVILNGVLEWLGVDQEYVVEKEWGKRSKKKSKGRIVTESPRTLQLQGLREALRVLRPGGTLCLAIENRIRSHYFFGMPDDHNGLPFCSLLSRKLANLYSLLAIGQPYRAYTYTARGLNRLLSQAGFSDRIFFTSFPSYEQPVTILPLNSRLLEFYLANEEAQSQGIRGRILNLFLRATKLAKATVPNFIVVARREKELSPNGDNHTFCETVLRNWSTLFPGTQKPRNISLIKLKSRMERGAPVSFLVFSEEGKKDPIGYLKVNRDSVGLKTVMNEANVYRKIYPRCTASRNGLAEQKFHGPLAGHYMISRLPLNGRPIQQRLFQNPNRYGLDSEEKTGDFYRCLQRAIDWLILFNSETRTRFLTFESFWDRFVDNRLASLKPKGDLNLPDDFLKTYNVKLKKLAGEDKLWLGPLHGDFNFCNLLFNSQSIGVVDWEYGEEESFPIFDVLNLFMQSAVEHTSFNRLYQVENLFSSRSENGFTPITNDLLNHYARCQGLSPEFVKACAPIFILDLLQRDYGDLDFPLRSADLFVKLLQVVLDT